MRAKWLQAGAGSVGAAAAVAGLVIAGVGNGNAAHEVHLSSGAAWLPSSQVGQVTLLDGASAEIAAQVQVAPQGDPLDVVQQGATAYAIDHRTGTIRRVDGATFDPTTPAAPIPAARDGLTAFVDEKSLYAMDSQQGVLVDTDPATLAPRGRPISLAAQLTAGGAAMDDAGTLWVIDPATGDLTSVNGSARATYRAFTKPGTSALTVAGGKPVVVNTTDRTASTADPRTGVPSALNLDLRPTDKVAVSGSPHSARLYVVTSRGVLILCDLNDHNCDTTVPLDPAATDLGAAVEAGNRLFVPDYGGGRVWVINLDDRSVLAKPQVLPPGPFQLLTRDGVVFFNDPNSEKAGVVRLDGGVQPAAKYDPKDPSKGLHAPPNTSTKQPPSQQPPKQQQKQDQQTRHDTTPPSQTPNPNPGTTGPPTTTATPPPDGQTPPPAKPQLHITVSNAAPTIDDDVTVRVTNSNGPAPKSATWDFGDGTNGAGTTVTHRWTTAKTYQVTVTATLQDMRTASTSLSLTVSPPAPVTVPNVVGRTQADAQSALQNVGLNPVISTVTSNTVPAGVVITQNPTAGSSAARGSDVAITVSSGPTSVDLLARAPGASWSSGAGTLPFNGSDVDTRGFALRRDGQYQLNGQPCRLEDGSAPSYLEMQPQWVNDGWIEGTYTLAAPVIAGDHFRATVGFIKCDGVRQPQLSQVTFGVDAKAPGGAECAGGLAHKPQTGTLLDIDVDLTNCAGATKITLRVDADGRSEQDWASWVSPRIEG